MVAIQLRLIQADIRRDPAAAEALVTTASDELSRSLEELRELARGIHPAVLEQGIASALTSLSARSAVPTAVSCEALGEVPRPIELALYFVACEALANVAKYAHADRRLDPAHPHRRRRRDRDRRRRRRRRGRERRFRPAGPAGPRRGAGRPPARDEPHGGGDGRQRGAAVQVVIADDNLLMREGIASLLRRAGIEVVGEAGDADELLRAVEEHRPEVAIVDVRMPPTHTDEGLRAAQEIRARHPRTGIVILSQTVEAGTALQILAARPEGLGYLLKDRVTDIEDFAGTLRRVAAGGCALDPQVVTQLLASPPDGGRIGTLTPRERDVLTLVAEGRSNKGAGERLGVTERAVQKHVTAIFDKLGLTAGEDDNRRILAVLHLPAAGCALRA